MDSFFFNITDTMYKSSTLYENGNEYIKRVDISNGVVFLQISLFNTKELDFHIKNLDRMVMISVIEKGSLDIFDKIQNKNFKQNAEKISIYCSSKQNLVLNTQKGQKTNLFILFIADFFLKRYLSSNTDEAIDFLYTKIQKDISFEHISTHPTDALSLYIIDKITNTDTKNTMKSIRCEHNAIEFLIHRLSLCDMQKKNLDEEDIRISKKAKDTLLANFKNPPTIARLAHLCATNESKLKKVFKKVFKTTIYSYIQKLRLEEANILLKEQSFTIGEISLKVGYRHQGHFSKLFFKTYGVYPKDLLQK